MAIDIEDLGGWFGRTETRSDIVSNNAVQGLAAMLDREEAEPQAGDTVPANGHRIHYDRPTPSKSKAIPGWLSTVR